MNKFKDYNLMKSIREIISKNNTKIYNSHKVHRVTGFAERKPLTRRRDEPLLDFRTIKGIILSGVPKQVKRAFVVRSDGRLGLASPLSPAKGDVGRVIPFYKAKRKPSNIVASLIG